MPRERSIGQGLPQKSRCKTRRLPLFLTMSWVCSGTFKKNGKRSVILGASLALAKRAGRHDWLWLLIRHRAQSKRCLR